MGRGRKLVKSIEMQRRLMMMSLQQLWTEVRGKEMPQDLTGRDLLGCMQSISDAATNHFAVNCESGLGVVVLDSRPTYGTHQYSSRDGRLGHIW